MSLLAELIDSILAAPEQFIDVATHDPVSALLVAVGGVLVGAPLVFFGILVLGAVVDLIRPESSAVEHP